MATSTVNHVDALVRNDAYLTKLSFLQVVGRNLVGSVERLGSEDSADSATPDIVNGFSPGDAVFSDSLGCGARPGAAAQFVAVPSEWLYRLPQNVDRVQAAAVLRPGATAYLALYRQGRLRPGETGFIGGPVEAWVGTRWCGLCAPEPSLSPPHASPTSVIVLVSAPALRFTTALWRSRRTCARR